MGVLLVVMSKFIMKQAVEKKGGVVSFGSQLPANKVVSH